MLRRTMERCAVAVAVACGTLLAQGQIQRNDGLSRSFSKPADAAKVAVVYLFPEQVTVPVGKVSQVALHFRIAQGLHINSHTPKDEFLIPTTFSIPEGAGVRLAGASYPAGTDLTLPLDPSTKLNVYSGEFTIQARIVATAGDHLVEARLRYQACDNHACMPPRTIPVAIDVVAK